MMQPLILIIKVFFLENMTVIALAGLPANSFLGWRHRVWHGHPLDLEDEGGVPRSHYELLQRRAQSQGVRHRGRAFKFYSVES